MTKFYCGLNPMEIRTIDMRVIPKIMNKWCGGALIGSLLLLLVLRYVVMEKRIGESYLTSSLTLNSSYHLKSLQDAVSPSAEISDTSNLLISSDILVSNLFTQRNFSGKVQSALHTWNYMKHVVDYAQSLPNGVEAIRQAGVAWDSLMNSVEKGQNGDLTETSFLSSKEKQCPYFLDKMNTTELGGNGYSLTIPCGLIQGSSVTIIGIPNRLLGNFQFDFMGESLPGEPNPPIILHYNVRLHGDKLTEDPVIVQNTWTAANDWGAEERCPSEVPGNEKRVDELIQCNYMVGKEETQKFASGKSSNVSRRYFPFKQRYPSVMTLRTGEEGIQMTVDGKHITSFAYRDRLEPWLVNNVKISGDLELISVLASGLPTSESLDTIADLEALTSIPLLPNKPLDLFVGVFSTANNFNRRMAVRRTWMQYPEVRSGSVAVRFFVGLHKNQKVNEELWKEIQTYGDIQLMPFIDYYTLITWKTVAICTFGTRAVSAKYIMKTDDDSFVRADQVIAALKRADVTHGGLMYGLINTESRPDRNPSSKWYISVKEWQQDTYPPWAHGPGYVISHNIANAVYKKHKRGHLKMFKLEDVAMGIWIEKMREEGLEVSYVKEERVYHLGCKNGYVVAHYQSPRQMLCLWQKLLEVKAAVCCGNGEL